MKRLRLFIVTALIALFATVLPAHAEPAWSLTFTADKTFLAASESFTPLTATASQAVSTPYSIVIRNAKGEVKANCKATAVCSWSAYPPPGGSVSFTAEIRNGTTNTVVATAGPITVSRETWTLTLAADKTHLAASESFTPLTATASDVVRSPYSIVIRGPQGEVKGNCDGRDFCKSAAYPLPGESVRYTAEISDGTSGTVLATAGPVTVSRGTWTLSFAADNTSLAASQSFTPLTATASDVVRSPYSIVIRGPQGEVKGNCDGRDFCKSAAYPLPGESVRYTAEISDGTSGTVLATAGVTVSRANWTLGITASRTSLPDSTSTASVTAQANEPVLTGYKIRLIGDGGGIAKSCSGSSSTKSCSLNSGAGEDGVASYRAQIVDSAGSTVFASAGPVTITSLSASEIADSAVVLEYQQALLSRYGSELSACLALGEKLRTHAARSSVPDVTLVCISQGLERAVRFLVDTLGEGGAANAIESLVSALENPEPSSYNPDCDFVGFNGECLDEGSPGSSLPEPEPEPDPSGAGVQPPGNCMSSAAKQDLLDSLPIEYHHLATQYGEWADIFNGIVSKYGLDVHDAARAWNVIPVPHHGRHPVEYHRWVFANLRRADSLANGDVTEFKRLFNQYVADPVRDDPTMLRVAYWKCRR